MGNFFFHMYKHKSGNKHGFDSRALILLEDFQIESERSINFGFSGKSHIKWNTLAVYNLVKENRDTKGRIRD